MEPASFLAIDPGRDLGFAYCLAGGEGLRHGVWRFKQTCMGAAYAEFVTRLKTVLRDLPRCQVGVELMTVVTHEDDAGNQRVDAAQILKSSGWPTHAQTVCYMLGLPEPIFIPIQTWRSATHGKTRAPNTIKDSERSRWFKDCAISYASRQGWAVDGPDEAEALCMLDYLRITHEPDYAYAAGQSGRHQMAMAL